MKEVLLTVAQGLGDFVKALGFAGFFLCLGGLILLVLGMKFLDFTMSTLERTHRNWRRLPPWLRQSLLIVGGFTFLPTIWALIPWRAALLAVVCAALVVLSVGGAVFGQRYGVHDSPWAAWSYHLRVTTKRKRFGKGLDNGTGKKKNRAVSMRLGPFEDTVIAHPGEGISAAELAKQFNDGTLASSIANQFGWHDVKGLSAEPQMDGTVLVRVGHQIRQAETLEPEWLQA